MSDMTKYLRSIDETIAAELMEELEAENAALKARCESEEDAAFRINLGRQLLAAQHRIKELREALEKCNSSFDFLSDCIQDQFENGVKWLNEDAANKFSSTYPEIRKGLDGLLDASIGIDAALATPDNINTGAELIIYKMDEDGSLLIRAIAAPAPTEIPAGWTLFSRAVMKEGNHAPD